MSGATARSAPPWRGIVLAIRLVWGAILVTAPRRVIRAVGAEDIRKSRMVARALGARHVVQGAVDLKVGRRADRLSAAIDGLHATTAALLAVTDRRWRRPAAIDTVIAGCFALTGRSTR